MLRLLSDENFRGEILRGLRRRLPDVDVVRVQDVGLASAEDAAILAWAATEGRVLVTHDRNTIPEFADERIRHGLPMPGVFVVDDDLPAGHAIADLLLAVQCGAAIECHGLITYFPL